MFESIPPRGVGLLVAPAGSGKSVLLSHWIGDRDGCWLSLSAAHNDARRLAADLVQGLHRSYPSFDPSVARLAGGGGGGGRLGESFIDAVIAEFADLPPSVLLVLDDLHHLTNPDILSDLARLLSNLPSTARALVSSRWDLPLRLAQMRLEGTLVELRAAELAFAQDEALEMLQLTSGRDIRPEQASGLLARTDGWAAGLRLAALSLSNVSDIDEFVEHFAGDDRLIVDYLSTKILQDLDEHIRSFLLRTSVLEWLSPGLCTAVTGDENSHATLRNLVEHGLFLTPTQGGADRFRYHQLFADLLRYQFAAEDPAALIQCRRRAASWLLAHHEYAEAVEQLLAAGDHEAAFRILAIEGHRLFEVGEVATLHRLLRQVHDAYPAPPPVVSIHLLGAQVGADEFTAAAENHRQLHQRGDLSPGEKVAADSLVLVLGHGHLAVNELRRIAAQVLEALPHVERSTVPNFSGVGGADSCETMAAFHSSLGSFLAGDLHTCLVGLDDALNLPGTRYPIWRIQVLGLMALANAGRGYLAEAETFAFEALETARAAHAMDHISSSFAHLALAATNDDRLDLATAALHLDAAHASISRCRRPLYDALLHLQQVRHAALDDGAEVALTLLRVAPAGRVRRAMIQESLDSIETQLLIRTGAVREALHKARSTSPSAPAARIDALIATSSIPEARRVLDEWVFQASNLRASIEHGVRTAVVTQQEGNAGHASMLLTEVALKADAQGLLGLFLDTPLALGLLRTAVPTRNLPHVRKLLDHRLSTEVRQGSDQLIEQLTPRELIVLEYLPTRLGNEQIAQALYVSVNTLKTHLRNVYRKLDSPGRDAAVERATSIGLI